MEQHAVPQDITGFKFKLVGDMTLKQFGELAAGAILAYLFYASNWHPFLKWPFVILFGGLGIALAFVPIEERPLDLWIINFLRAIYHPTFYVWRKNVTGAAILDTGVTTKPPVAKPVVPQVPEEANLGLSPWPFPKEKEEKPEPAEPVKPVEPEPEITEAPAPVVPPTPSLSIDELQKLREKKVLELEEAKKQLQTATKQAKEEAYKTEVGASVVTVDQLAKLREDKAAQADKEVKSQVAVGETELNDLIAQNKELVNQIEEIKKKIGQLAGVDTTQLQQQLTTLVAQKDNLSGRIAALSDRLAAQRAAPLTQAAYQEPRPTAVPGVKILDKLKTEPTTISLSKQPNVISGMVTGTRGEPLEGVIILIKDKAGNSLRALKTNKLGQFVVATPMENGTYYVELEKAGLTFSVLEVTLSGQVLAPLEIPAQPAN